MVFVQFVDYKEERMSDPLGPFEYVQERYGELIDDKNNVVAVKNGDMWTLGGYERFSDMVVYGEKQ